MTLLERYLIMGRTSALVLSAAFAPEFPAARAEEGQSLADVFLRTCVSHIDDVSQLSQLVRAERAEKIEMSDHGMDGATADAETWRLDSPVRRTILYFKNGDRNGRRFAMCLVRQDADVFNASVDALSRALALRRVPSKGEDSMRRSSFMIADSAALVEISASQGPFTRFTLVSMTKLRGAGP